MSYVTAAGRHTRGVNLSFAGTISQATDGVVATYELGDATELRLFLDAATTAVGAFTMDFAVQYSHDGSTGWGAPLIQHWDGAASALHEVAQNVTEVDTPYQAIGIKRFMRVSITHTGDPGSVTYTLSGEAI